MLLKDRTTAELAEHIAPWGATPRIARQLQSLAVKRAVVELPPGAVWLGETPAYPHLVFRVGRAAWGVQFHPEVSPATYGVWAAHHADDWARWGIDGEAVVQDLVRRGGEVEAAGRELARRYAGVLRAR